MHLSLLQVVENENQQQGGFVWHMSDKERIVCFVMVISDHIFDELKE